MITRHLLTLAVVCSIICSSHLQAETLMVGIANSFNLPDKLVEIKRALHDTGLELEYRTFPSERILRLIGNGEIALDIYRQPRAVADFPDLIQIRPPVDTKEFWLVTHSAELCKLNENERKERSVVGMRGSRLFENFVYPLFDDHIVVDTSNQISQVLHRKRVDFSIRALDPLKRSDAVVGTNSVVCGEQPFFSITFYSYIHSRYAWAIPMIEKSYRARFPLNE